MCNTRYNACECHLILFVASYHIALHRMKSHYITSHCVTSKYITSHHTASHYIISHKITSHNVAHRELKERIERHSQEDSDSEDGHRKKKRQKRQELEAKMKDKKYQPDGDEGRKQDRIVDLDSGTAYKSSAGNHPVNGNSTAKYNGPSGTDMDRTPDRRPQGGPDPSNGPYYSSQNTAGTTPNTPDISPPNYRRQAPGPGAGAGQGRDMYQAPPSLVDRMGQGYGPSPEGIAYTERNYDAPYARRDMIPPNPNGYQNQYQDQYQHQHQSQSPPRNPHRDHDPHYAEQSQSNYSRSVYEPQNHPDNPDRFSRQQCEERSRGASNYVRREEYSEERSAQGVLRNKNVEHSQGRSNEKGGTVSQPRVYQGGYEKEDRKYSTYTPGDDSAPQSHTQQFMQKQTDEKRLEFERRVALATRSTQQQQQDRPGPGPPRW